MLALTDGLLLYHSSYTEVREVNLELCRPGKDFGRGFYLTTSIEQARSFSLLSARKRSSMTGDAGKAGCGYVTSFVYHESGNLSFCAFKEANEEWLHFVSANRRGSLFPELLDRYKGVDVVAGKIANDQTARTLQLYVSGAYGPPGSPQADSIAIATLLPNRLDNQFCFRTGVAVAALDYVGCEVCHG